MIGGDDFSPVYESGVNAGKNKLSVYIQRNIPVWRGIRSAFIDINDNNKAYKAGKNVIGFIDTDDFTKLTSREEELYFFKLKYKKKLFRENNLNYKIFHPSDLKNHTMEELFDFLNIKKTA